MWDDKSAEEQTAYRSSTVRIMTEEEVTMKIMAAQTSTTPNRAAEPTHYHQNKLHLWPKRSWENNHTLSGYWEINGMKAHCLLDSGREGMLISPKFMQAMGIKTFDLETPIVLQLACRGSHSIVNQLWNECKNQIWSYMAWQILQHSQHWILWHYLRNTISTKT